MSFNKAFIKRSISVGCFWITLVATAMTQPDSRPYLLADAKRIVFLGNSITYAGDYVSLFESFYITEYPDSRAEIINVGLPSETVSGLSEPGHAEGVFPRPWLFSRLKSLLAKTNPDVVFACYGMNDGIYMPFDETRFDAYKKGMQRLRAELEKAGLKRIIFLTPPVHDDAEKGLDGYNLVLDCYAHWLLEQREAQGWEVIDLHFAMCTYLVEQRAANPAFRLANDGVHPGAEGHWLMAKSLFTYLDRAFDVSTTLEAFVNGTPEVAEIHQLIRKRQSVMKDAWLTDIGHERPGMSKGITMKQARKTYKQIERDIRRICCRQRIAYDGHTDYLQL